VADKQQMDQVDQVDQDFELSPRARERLEGLRYLGSFAEGEAARRDCATVTAVHGQDKADDHIELTALVDESDFIRDVRYHTLATGLELLAFDLLAELCIGVTVEQAARITPGHIKERLRYVYDQEEAPLPWPANQPFAVLVKLAQRHGGKQGDAPVGSDAAESPDGDWQRLGLFEKVRRIEEVLDEQVRPMLAADGGGLDLIDLRDDELVVEYHGLCGSCSAATGGTLFYIEDTLSSALGIELQVTVQGLEAEPFLDL